MRGSSEDRAQWLGRFILPHEPALRTWLSRRSLGDLDVDDVVQEAYAKLIMLSSVDTIRDHRSYLYQVAKSVVADHARRRKIVTIAANEIDLRSVPIDQPSVYEIVCSREELHRLATAIAALPEPTRTVFKLRRVDQMPQREIAEQMRMPESSVEKHISRALNHMSRLFGRGGKGRVDPSGKDSLSAWNGNESRDCTAD